MIEDVNGFVTTAVTAAVTAGGPPPPEGIVLACPLNSTGAPGGVSHAAEEGFLGTSIHLDCYQPEKLLKQVPAEVKALIGDPAQRELYEFAQAASTQAQNKGVCGEFCKQYQTKDQSKYGSTLKQAKLIAWTRRKFMEMDKARTVACAAKVGNKPLMPITAIESLLKALKTLYREGLQEIHGINPDNYPSTKFLNEVFATYEAAIPKTEAENTELRPELNLAYETARILITHVLRNKLLAPNGVIARADTIGDYALVADNLKYTQKKEGLNISILPHFCVTHKQNPFSYSFQNNDCITFSLESLVQDALEYQKFGSEWHRKLKPIQGQFSFAKTPTLLPYWFYSDVARQAPDLAQVRKFIETNEVTISLNNALTKAIMQVAKHRMEGDNMFYTPIAAQFYDTLPGTFYKDSSLERDFKKYVPEIEDISQIHDQEEAKYFADAFINIESHLRALLDMPNLSYGLYKCLVGTVIPLHKHASDSRSKQKPTDGKVSPLDFTFLTLVRILTESVLPNGREISAQVDWDATYKNQNGRIMDPTKFEYDWQNYIKAPGTPKDAEGNDPFGMMQLRQAWYKFFDEKINTYDKLQKFENIGSPDRTKIQIGINRELNTIEDRTKDLGDWVDYHNKHFAVLNPTIAA